MVVIAKPVQVNAQKQVIHGNKHRDQNEICSPVSHLVYDVCRAIYFTQAMIGLFPVKRLYDQLV